MLRNTPAFSGFSTHDIAASKAFYENILGLKVIENEMGMLEVYIRETRPFVIYPKDNHRPATFTVLNFEVTKIQEKVDALTAKGVVFEQYDSPLKTDTKGICWPPEDTSWPIIAWFKDPGGNILSLIEERRNENTTL